MASRRAWATLVACEMLPILLPGTLGSCVPSMIYFDLFWIRSHSPHNLEVRTVHMEAARAALAQHRAAKFAHHPPAGLTPHDGMRPRVRSRRHTIAKERDDPHPGRYRRHGRATTPARRRRARTECWPGQEPLPHRRSSLQGSDILILRMESQWHQHRGAGTKPRQDYHSTAAPRPINRSGEVRQKTLGSSTTRRRTVGAQYGFG